MHNAEVEKRIGSSSAWASGRVAAGISSSLEIAVGWFPHRLEQFIRGFLAGQSGERAARRRPDAGEEDRLGSLSAHPGSFPFMCYS